MFVNILLFTLVGGFVAIVALGHVLLFNAIWPVLACTAGRTASPR